jgi:solute carrier family 30 (zinc transporter), member 5/7
MDTVFEIIAETYADKSQRKILYFLGLTLCFMVLEFVYGWLSNSLSLMSDSCHMLVDSLALMLGLCAAYVSKHTKPTRNMPYGYYRIESLSALCNSLFLIAVSYNLAFNSIDRLVHP